MSKSLVTNLHIELRYDERSEIDYFLQVTWRNVDDLTNTTRGSLKKPDVRNRCRQFDVTHVFTTHTRTRNFNTTLVTYDAAKPYSLVLAAGALPILSRTEDTFTEQTITFWL